MTLLVWFNILTNLFVIYPVILGFQNYKPIEATIWLMNGLSSFVYHLADTDVADVPDSIYTVFRHVDYLFTDITVMSVIFLLFIPHTNLRHSSIMATIPFFVLLIELKQPIYYHWLPIIAVFTISSIIYDIHLKVNCMERYERINKSVLYIGLFMNSIQFMFYYYFPIVIPRLYDFFHGMHHMLGFISISFYFKSIQFKKNHKIENEIWIDNDDTPVIDLSGLDSQRISHSQKIHKRHVSMS